jgi:MFS family permease
VQVAASRDANFNNRRFVAYPISLEKKLPQAHFPDKTGAIMATPNTTLSAAADTRSPLQKIFSSTNFFAEFTIGPFWAIPMDIAPRFSGSASGLMNVGSALAAAVSPLVAGYVIQKTGNWDLPFLGSIGLLLFGAIMAYWMKPNEPLLEQNSRLLAVERCKVLAKKKSGRLRQDSADNGQRR